MADIQTPDPHINGAPVPVSSETVGSKRQRRPSVRLGDIGGDHSYSRRSNKPWNSKSRPLTNLNSENNLDSVAIGSWRGTNTNTNTKRSNWGSADEDNEEDDDENSGGSPLEEQRSMHSLENVAMEGGRPTPPSDTYVRVWLNGLGLGRYGPVFEIHEVDHEVLPMLTLEDLKDMGITAVGSRRKIYSAIQNLGKGIPPHHHSIY